MGVAAALGAGLACGLVNGALVAYVGIPSFIATYGMLWVAHGHGLRLHEGRGDPRLPRRLPHARRRVRRRHSRAGADRRAADRPARRSAPRASGARSTPSAATPSPEAHRHAGEAPPRDRVRALGRARRLCRPGGHRARERRRFGHRRGAAAHRDRRVCRRHLALRRRRRHRRHRDRRADPRAGRQRHEHAQHRHVLAGLRHGRDRYSQCSPTFPSRGGCMARSHHPCRNAGLARRRVLPGQAEDRRLHEERHQPVLEGARGRRQGRQAARRRHRARRADQARQHRGADAPWSRTG